jgi:hypothetical protein
MREVIIVLSAIILFSCEQNQKGALEGSWMRKGTINYNEGKPLDTLEFKGVFFEVYTKGSYSLLMNEIKIDSVTGEDVDKGISEAGTYTLNKNKLKRKYTMEQVGLVMG